MENKKFYALMLVETERNYVSFAELRASSYADLSKKVDEQMDFYESCNKGRYTILEMRVTNELERHLDDKITFMYKELLAFEKYADSIIEKYNTMLADNLITTVEYEDTVHYYRDEKHCLRRYIVQAIRRARRNSVDISCREAVNMYLDMELLELL